MSVWRTLSPRSTGSRARSRSTRCSGICSAPSSAAPARHPGLRLIGPLIGIFDQPDAETGFRAVEPLFKDPDPWLRATSHMIVAHLRLNFGQSSEVARADMQEALAGFRAIGERWGIGFSLSALGDLAAAESEFAQAVRWQYEALALVREVGVREDIPQLEVKLATSCGWPAT